MKSEIKEGDVVHLNSDVLKLMTVSSIGNDTAILMWFDGYTLTSSIVPLVALTVVKTE